MKKALILLLILNTAHAFIATGTNTLSSTNGLNTIGFTFNNGTLSDNNGDFYYYANALWTNGNGGIKDMGVIDVKACDQTGYTKSNIPATDGHSYCIKTNEGSYATITIKSKTATSLTFEWAHQRDGTEILTTSNENITSVPQEFNINYALIGIIIVLIIILIIIWKYR